MITVATRLALAFACLLLAAAAPAAAKLPTGFSDTEVTTFDGAIALAFAPGGRLLVAGRTGQLRVFQHGVLSPPALSIKDRLCWDAERGMTGIALDPAFESNGYVYLYYTYDKHHTADKGACATRSSRAPVNRVSRFTLGTNNLVVAGSEKVLLDNIPSFGGNHNSGDLGFGKDGYLYVSVGDGGCDYARDSGCFNKNDAARDQNVLLGKILRITRTGGVPPDNPFHGRGSASCARTGITRPGLKCRETWVWGLRNPFRFAFDPAAAGTRMFIDEVGESTWEEINLGAAGADYGWNAREGACPTGAVVTCPPPRGMTSPIFKYPHRSGCAAITGGAFVPAGAWPAEYEGGYLYGDFTCGQIRLLKLGLRGYESSRFATRLGPVIDLVFGPDGDTPALYYTVSKDNLWHVRKISYAKPESDGSRLRGCGGGVGTALLVLGLCGVPYLRRRLRLRLS